MDKATKRPIQRKWVIAMAVVFSVFFLYFNYAMIVGAFAVSYSSIFSTWRLQQWCKIANTMDYAKASQNTRFYIAHESIETPTKERKLWAENMIYWSNNLPGDYELVSLFFSSTTLYADDGALFGSLQLHLVAKNSVTGEDFTGDFILPVVCGFAFDTGRFAFRTHLSPSIADASNMAYAELLCSDLSAIFLI